ncbi:MAG: DUF371 domain-containing protein [Thaumarchaeota archaeon]|nr:DUF371 domain-containing protein [Nitrososphaerota archaeon]
MIAKARVNFYGHPMILALHPTTIEITKDRQLTRRGDCIIGVLADKAVSDLSPEMREALASDRSQVKVKIFVDDAIFVAKASGDSRLTLSNSRDIVLRTSEFVNERTLAVRADLAAIDIPRGVVAKLQRLGAHGVMEIEASNR